VTVSTHVYTAHLLDPAGDIELSVKGGRISLDATQAPHVRADLLVALPVESTLAKLDPRLNARLRVNVEAVGAGGVQSRSFHLGLRDFGAQHLPAEVPLLLASDDAMLTDFRAFVDTDYYDAASDLRSLCETVVRLALGDPTIVIEGPTANVTPVWDTLNIITNPGVELDIANWGIGSGATALDRTTAYHHTGVAAAVWTVTSATASDAYPVLDWEAHAASAGAWYAFSVWVALPGGSTGHVLLRFYDANGGNWGEVTGAPLASTGDWVLLEAAGTAPPRTAHVFPIIRVEGATVGAAVLADDATLSADQFVVPSFSGATPSTAAYAYSWTDVPHASTSKRTALISDTASPEAVIWRAGQSALEFLHPLVQVAGLRLVCDEARAWTLRDADYLADGTLSITDRVNMIDAAQSIQRSGDVWFDAAVTTYTWRDSWGMQVVRVDTFQLTPTPVHVAHFEKNTPYPGPGFSEYAVLRAQGRGREVSATIVSDWRARAEQPVQITAGGTPRQAGLTQSVTFNLDSDEMTVTTRTTELRAGAIDLLDGTIDALVGTIDSL
jgi:hypothetical protein